MSIALPCFDARPGTIIWVFGAPLNSSSICGYCRGLVLEHDNLRCGGGFRRYRDSAQDVSWAEPVDWPETPVSQVSVYIVPVKPWMQIIKLPETQLD
jgi:hypothetical protein